MCTKWRKESQLVCLACLSGCLSTALLAKPIFFIHPSHAHPHTHSHSPLLLPKRLPSLGRFPRRPITDTASYCIGSAALPPSIASPPGIRCLSGTTTEPSVAALRILTGRLNFFGCITFRPYKTVLHSDSTLFIGVVDRFFPITRLARVLGNNTNPSLRSCGYRPIGVARWPVCSFNNPA